MITMVTLLKYDPTSDPLTGLIFFAIVIIGLIITGLQGDKTGDYSNMEKWAKWTDVSETTGNRSKSAARRKRRRRLEKKYNLPYESLSYQTDEFMDTIEPRKKRKS